ncbi:MAG TPA: 4-hydroxythreonine-4-phosphate dehydrogenase PdxA, partial [Verrucomicrobiae bacterium]
MKSARPILGLTMGDPAGIGPEICLRALREPQMLQRCTPVLFGDPAVLNRVAKAAGIADANTRIARVAEL